MRRRDLVGLAARCHQCGRWESVSVLRAGRRARYWCRHCGAVVSCGRSALRPVNEFGGRRDRFR